MSLSFPDLQKLSPWVTAEVVCWVLLDHQMDKVELRGGPSHPGFFAQRHEGEMRFLEWCCRLYGSYMGKMYAY